MATNRNEIRKQQKYRFQKYKTCRNTYRVIWLEFKKRDLENRITPV